MEKNKSLTKNNSKEINEPKIKSQRNYINTIPKSFDNLNSSEFVYKSYTENKNQYDFKFQMNSIINNNLVQNIVESYNMKKSKRSRTNIKEKSVKDNKETSNIFIKKQNKLNNNELNELKNNTNEIINFLKLNLITNTEKPKRKLKTLI